MYESSAPSTDLISTLRRRVARQTLAFPTDPLNIGLASLGGVALLLTLLLDAPWPVVLAAGVTLAAGLTGIAVARSRLVMRVLPVTLGGATLALLVGLLALAPYPVLWLALIPSGGAVSASVIYYRGARRGLVWGSLQMGVALVASLLALADPAADSALLTQALLAGEALIMLTHSVLLIFMPEQATTEAHTADISRQSLELENLATQISATADGMGRASAAIHLVTGQQSSGAREQAAVITQAIAMLSEFILLAEQVRDQAREVADLFEQTAAASARGQETIQRAIDGMTQIRAQVTAIATNIAQLAGQTRRIDEIITSVGEIATQSNLLALNASIEAARAGTQGRGFAVVADEVRTLAQQSQQAAAQVQGILSEIREAMTQTVHATQIGDQQVDAGMALSEQTGEVITQLAENVDASTNALHNIVVAIEEQTVGLEQITHSMQNIQDVTQNNLESNRTAEIVAENLNRLSEELLAVIAQHGMGDHEPV